MTQSNCRNCRDDWNAARKGLTVNVQKSYIVNFNAYRNSAVPVFHLYNQELEERDSFTYLGMLFDKHMNLHHAATHALDLLMQLYIEWKILVLKRGFLAGLMRCCGLSRHMRCQMACMPVRFGLHNFWSMTMVSATLDTATLDAGRTHGVFKENFGN